MIDLLLEILKTAVSFPTVVVTVPLLLAIAYWLFSAVTGGGGVDGAVEGAMEGLLDGAVEGALDGVAEGALDGLAEGALEGAAEGVAEGATEGWGLARILGCLGLTAVPVSIFASMVLVFSWGLSVLLSRLVGTRIGLVPTTFLVGSCILAVAVVLGVLVTALVVRSLGPLFRGPDPLKRRTLVGQPVVIRTLSVDDGFGQAEYADGQAGLLLDVRCAAPNTLTRGDRVLITRYDRHEDVYYVDPERTAEAEQLAGEPAGPRGSEAPGSADEPVTPDGVPPATTT